MEEEAEEDDDAGSAEVADACFVVDGRARIVRRSPVQSISANAIARTSSARATSDHESVVNACANACSGKSAAAERQRAERRAHSGRLASASGVCGCFWPALGASLDWAAKEEIHHMQRRYIPNALVNGPHSGARAHFHTTCLF